MSESLGPYFQFYIFSPGRIIFASTQTRKVAAEVGNQAVLAACDPAIAAGQEALATRNAWSRTKKATAARGGGRAMTLDHEVDRAVSGMFKSAGNCIDSLTPSNPLVALAKEFLSKAYPEGAEAFTKLPQEDELAAVKKLRKRLDDAGDLEPFVKPLALGAFVSQLDDLLPEFEDALAEKKQEETTYDEVEAADARAQERLLQLVAKILGEYNLDTADHIRTRSLLMDHIVDQNTRIGQNHRRRRFRDVNPDTGEEVEPAAPAAAPAAPSTPANPKPA